MAIKLVRLDISTNRLVEDQDLDFVKDYEYDAAGNLTKDATGKLFAYDAENRQKSFGVNDSNSNGGTYIYDGLGRRVKKTVGSVETIFVYDAFGKLAAEYETNLQQTSATKYLTTDNLGSVRIVTNQSGTVLSRHDYQAFGEEVYAGTANRTSTDKYSSIDNIRQQFTGYERDTESGLDYAQARYYNTKHGRFTSVDPLTASASIRNPQTFNRYSYGLNSPYKFTDPLGLLPLSPGGNSACGTFCSNWDGANSGGALSAAEASGESWSIYTIIEYTDTRTINTTMTSGSQTAEIAVTITKIWYVAYDANGGEVVGPGIPPKPPSTNIGVQVNDVQGQGQFRSEQKNIIELVTRDIISVAEAKNVNPRVALALGIQESFLGVGAVAKENIDPNTGEAYPHKLPRVNPLQLSGGRAKAGEESRKYNIEGAMDEFIRQHKRKPDFRSAIAGYGGEGVRPSQANYSAKLLAVYDKISYVTHPTRWRCISGC